MFMQGFSAFKENIYLRVELHDFDDSFIKIPKGLEASCKLYKKWFYSWPM